MAALSENCRLSLQPRRKFIIVQSNMIRLPTHVHRKKNCPDEEKKPKLYLNPPSVHHELYEYKQYYKKL